MSYHRKLSEGTTIPLDSNVFDGHEHLQYLSVKKHTSNSTLIKTSDRYNQLGSDINRQPVTSTKIDPSYKPLSPTMLAAFTVATTALSDTRDYSLPFIADEYQKSFDFNTSTNKKSCIKRGGIKSDKDTIGKTSSAIVDRGISNDGKSFKIRSSKGHGKKRSSSNIHQNMFLTKNAHIKRPRNAWIHFRCHYGQALKFQDPTLRAEEISKQASFKWAKLSEKGKKPWHDLAQQEKKVHKEAFPDYRYRPRRSSAVTVTSATIQSRKKN
ncbi:HMG-box [Backusella circina FSU 941]|nr:HMG-box [Backusella circina FSU 941]